MSDWRQMLKDCLRLEEGLTDWEVGFVESLNHKADQARWTPTDRQAAILQEIWEKKT